MTGNHCREDVVAGEQSVAYSENRLAVHEDHPLRDGYGSAEPG